MKIKKYKTLGLVGRFKPLHNGGAEFLEEACRQSEFVLIGIGSTNRYDYRNPFTAQETKEMIDSFLSKKFSNYKIFFIPDFGHFKKYSDGQKWAEYVRKRFGNLDHFITGNPYVAKVLKKYYTILNPFEIIPTKKQIILHATPIRIKIVKNQDWKSLVPKEVSDYLISKGLIERFKKEFGKETLENSQNKLILTADEETARIKK